MKNRSRSSFALVAVIALCLSADMVIARNHSPRQEENPGDPVLGHRIARGIVFDGKLWLCGAELPGDWYGGLVSLSLSDNSRKVYFQHGVIDIIKIGTDLWALRRTMPNAREYIVSVLRSGAFEDRARFTSGNPRLLLLNRSGRLAEISARELRVLSEHDDKWGVVQLKHDPSWPRFWDRQAARISAALPKSGNDIYVGADYGEWGGGLQRVDISTGAVTNIERRDTKHPCTDSLNKECDPVTGVIPDPRNNDCVFASIGLVDLGRILRVCGERIDKIFEKSVPGDGNKETEPFNALTSAKDGGFWGITQYVLYHFASDGKQDHEYQLPDLNPISGVYLSRKVPGVIVINLDVNWFPAGYRPLIVPLEN
jgi:hypothetical protein